MLEFLVLLILCILFIKKIRNTDIWEFATSGIFKILQTPKVENFVEKLEDVDNNDVDADFDPTKLLVCRDCDHCKENFTEIVDDTDDEDKIDNIFNVEDVMRHNLNLKKFVYPKVYEAVITNSRVEQSIKRVAEIQTEDCVHSNSTHKDESEVYEQMLQKQKRRAIDILKDMQSNLAHPFLFATSYVLHKAFPRILSGITINSNKAKMLKAAEKTMPGVPFIFLPLHRSHLDYILVTFYLFNNHIQSPLVAAGNNLKIPVFGYLLRGLGAFFIKRKIDPEDGRKDFVYRSILQVYMEECLKMKHNFEFFIEGGRSRTGKPIIPKSGILSVVIEAFQTGLIKDALIVPVSFNYERLVEGNFVGEQLGKPKKKESFLTAIKSFWKVLNSKYGYVNINFSTPYSLKELIKSINVINNVGNPRERILTNQLSTTSLYGVDVSTDSNRLLVDSIARHVIYDCSKATMIMPTNAVSYLLLHYFRNGTTLRNLANAVDELSHDIGRHHFFGYEQFKNTEDLVWHAINLMKENLVDIQKNGIIKPNSALQSLIELSYYSNILTPHLIIDALVCVCANPSKGAKKRLDEVIEDCLEYCDMLRYEFVFTKPCLCLTSLIKKSIVKLRQLGVIHLAEENGRNGISANGKLSKDHKRQALIATLSPINYCYLATAESLYQLLNVENGMLENDFLKICLRRIRYKIEVKKCEYPWSISVDSIKNCIKLLQRWLMIDVRNVAGKRILTLNSSYNSPEGVLEIKNKFQKFVNLD